MQNRNPYDSLGVPPVGEIAGEKASKDPGEIEYRQGYATFHQGEPAVPSQLGNVEAEADEGDATQNDHDCNEQERPRGLAERSNQGMKSNTLNSWILERHKEGYDENGKHPR